MSIQVNEFRHIPGENDTEYIKLLKEALERQKQITSKAIAKIKELSNYSESPNNWIPCSERLPCDHERYLLTEEVHYTTGRIIRRVLLAFYDDENDEWYEEMGEDVEVVSYPLAWMPLPECYRGDENVK